MKICPNCNNQFDDAVAFCDKCGTPLAAAAPAQPVQPAYAQPAYTQPVAPAPKKKMPTWVPIAIIAAILVIVGIVVGVIFLTKDKDDKDDGESKTKVESSTDVQNNDPTVPNNEVTPNGPSNNVTPIVPNTPSGGNVAFTVGNIQGNSYVNEWAGFSINLPGWELEIDGDVFEAYENDGYSEIEIDYVDTAGVMDYNSFMAMMEEEMYADAEADGISLSKEKAQIGGLTYDSYYAADGDECGYMLFSQKDNYIIMIMVTADSEAELKSVLNCFQDL